MSDDDTFIFTLLFRYTTEYNKNSKNIYSYTYLHATFHKFIFKDIVLLREPSVLRSAFRNIATTRDYVIYDAITARLDP